MSVEDATLDVLLLDFIFLLRSEAQFLPTKYGEMDQKVKPSGPILFGAAHVCMPVSKKGILSTMEVEQMKASLSHCSVMV